MWNALVMIYYETSDYLFIVGDILKDIRLPWDGPGLGPEYFAYG